MGRDSTASIMSFFFCRLCSRTVMAWGEMDFYEASKPHLLHVAAIKLSQSYCIVCSSCVTRDASVTRRSHEEPGAPDAARSQSYNFLTPVSIIKEHKHQKWGRKKHVLLTQTHSHSDSK